jgi:hypothetical protein
MSSVKYELGFISQKMTSFIVIALTTSTPTEITLTEMFLRYRNE